MMPNSLDPTRQGNGLNFNQFFLFILFFLFLNIIIIIIILISFILIDQPCLSFVSQVKKQNQTFFLNIIFELRLR